MKSHTVAISHYVTLTMVYPYCVLLPFRCGMKEATDPWTRLYTIYRWPGVRSGRGRVRTGRPPPIPTGPDSVTPTPAPTPPQPPPPPTAQPSPNPYHYDLTRPQRSCPMSGRAGPYPDMCTLPDMIKILFPNHHMRLSGCLRGLTVEFNTRC